MIFIVRLDISNVPPADYEEWSNRPAPAGATCYGMQGGIEMWALDASDRAMAWERVNLEIAGTEIEVLSVEERRGRP